MHPVTTQALAHLFPGAAVRIHGDLAAPITSIATDSRQARPGTLFFCLRGQRHNGEDFALAAVAAGALAVAAERELDLPPAVARVVVPDALAALSKAAARLYDDPSRGLVMVGVTGTNGKTTTTYLVESIAKAAGKRFGVIGTLGARLGDLTEALSNTTPFAHDVQRILAGFRDAAADGAVIEASSHALTLHRLDDVSFDVAVLTNLTRDHLDFHGTFEEYRAAKRKLFDRRAGKDGRPAVAVLNVDDPEGRALAGTLERRLTYGIGNDEAMLNATAVSMSASGSRFSVPALRPAPFSIRLPGAFNVANAMAALGIACALDLDVEAMAEGLETLERVPGRMISVPAPGVGVYLDYAHTPDALEQVLQAARALARGKLVCVFGCGGDRDAGKRPRMGRIAQHLADHVIVTTDNPRHEAPQAIIDAILSGMDAPAGTVEVVVDRAQAIARAIELAQPGDAVLIAGKGHEDYQIVGDERRPFSDEDVARAAIRQALR